VVVCVHSCVRENLRIRKCVVFVCVRERKNELEKGEKGKRIKKEREREREREREQKRDDVEVKREKV
jgi:hypothetical protein